jgi:peptidoglycan/LPS O-acetylase OafA/YrhL
MKINERLLFTLYLLGASCILFGALIKIQHWNNGPGIMFIGLFFCAVFSVLALLEIHQSKKINFQQKTLWTLGFIFFNTIAGIYYLLKARKELL